jgi:hypothetical protein
LDEAGEADAMSRLPLHTLNIPPRDPKEVQRAAGRIVVDAFRANGIEPRKAIDNPMCQSLAVSWSRGEIDRATFDHCCRNLLILNPKLGAP